jgi:hypothetical protein
VFDAFRFLVTGDEDAGWQAILNAGAAVPWVGSFGKQAIKHGDEVVEGLVGVGRRADPAPAGIVYRRTDQLGSKPYVGQAQSDTRYIERQGEHARANRNADFEFEILGRANPGAELDRLEEYYIRQGGGPTNLGNPSGALANRRHQMSEERYRRAGGDPW